MGYSDLIKTANILDSKIRLKEHVEFYMNIKLNGLHYVNFQADSNTISISMPDHSTHHHGTSYLLFKKSCCSINTARGQATDLKKFFDYLLIWDISLLDGDLLIILLGFVDYLRCVSTDKIAFTKAILGSAVKEVPIYRNLTNANHTLEIGYSKEGFMGIKNSSYPSYFTIKKALSTAIQYIFFLKDKTMYYSSISTNQIPKKIKYKDTILSGTMGLKPLSIVDLDYILESAGQKLETNIYSILLKQKVFMINEIDTFINSIPSHHYQNLLLFSVLKLFGLRDGEAANLMIDVSTVPSNLIYMEYSKARDILKNNLKGDLEYSKQTNTWVCYVIERTNEDYRSQHKSGSREIPLLYNSDQFLDLLLNALIEREILITYAKNTHNFLFVSRSNRNKGEPINGKTINSRYSYYAEKLLKEKDINLTNYSPHSFRHFFATYLLRVRREDIWDVSRWLGHSSIEITKSTYSHYLPRDDRNENTVMNMVDKFKNEE